MSTSSSQREVAFAKVSQGRAFGVRVGSLLGGRLRHMLRVWSFTSSSHHRCHNTNSTHTTPLRIQFDILLHVTIPTIPDTLQIHSITSPTMTSNLMDTEKGGEQTQYEGEHSDMMPHKQEAGQLGGMFSSNPSPQIYSLTSTSPFITSLFHHTQTRLARTQLGRDSYTHLFPPPPSSLLFLPADNVFNSLRGSRRQHKPAHVHARD